jgi:23S rRNA (guanine2445-N2)-methyltransferase / 23S rRNA (guanine2069-N7)-methyltransferase
MEVSEAGNRFLVNLVDYVDVGLFLEYRKVRKWIQEEAKGKDFLNLFGFTGTGSVSAAKGGAKATVTVDASITYLSWAEQNLRANGLVHSRNELVRSDVLDFLKSSPQSFDLCWVDPPVRFVNRNSALDFNIQEGHVDLLQLVFKRMRRKGRVLFTTNCRGFELAEKELTQDGVTCQEITHRMIPMDFERATPFRAWLFQLTS